MESGRDRFERCLRGLDGRCRPKPRRRLESARGAAIPRGIGGQRDPEPSPLGIGSLARDDADDDVGRTVEKNRSPKSVRIRTELTPPQLLAQDDHGRRPRFFLFRKKGSAEKRLNAQDVEQIRRDPPTADACSAAVTRDRVGLPVVNVDIDQARFMDGLSIVLEVRIGEIADTAAPLNPLESDEND